MDGVVDVEVEWTGAELHGRVGEHIIETTVTRLTGSNRSIEKPGDVHVDEFDREVTSRCFHVPFTILDTDECSLPKNHPMRHSCSPSSVCVNTNGSYDCSCPRLSTSKDDNDRSPWEVSFASSAKTSCPLMLSTQGCCTASAHTAEGKRCRARFHCPMDPCADGSHDCATSATCIRSESPNTIDHEGEKQDSLLSVQLYSCQCPEGLMGNGKTCRPGIDAPPQPKVMFDGVTPTALTIKNNFYCGCTKPKVDACSGFPPCQGKHEICTVSASTNNQPMCACRPGYVNHDEYGCVDVNPPTLKLRNDPRGDHILRLQQGDEYREHMVDIVDDNAEDYLRSLKVTYSQPLPPGCLTGVGEFHVNYTVAMPWANPPYVRITRRVIIEDINECSILSNSKLLKKFQKTCPQLIPQCDTEAGAECHNIVGTYSCQCPVRTSGDGFLPSAAFNENDTAYPRPSSFKGGTSCGDTSKPVITLQGPNPKIFRVAKYVGLVGVMSPYSRNHNEEAKEKLEADQRALYEKDIREMIRSTAGAELCATHDNPSVKAFDCITAIDHTYKGKIDLSNRVIVGDPVQKSILHWVVPYDVKDDAGNEAKTVYRDVTVDEVALTGVEKKIREEVAREEQSMMKRAIDAAIREEKKKWDNESRAPTNSRSRRNSADSSAKSCPTCPPCICSENEKSDAASCSAHCSDMSETCRKLSDDNYVYKLLLLLEDTFPPNLVPMFVLSFLAVGFLYVIQWMVTLIFNPRSYTNYDYGNYSSINDDMVLATRPEPRQTVPTQTHNGVNKMAPQIPPTASLATNNVHNGNNGAFFSPGSQRESHAQYDRQGPSSRYTPNNDLRSPYTPSSIRRETYDGSSVYQSPPLIVPSKNGDGAPRRSPYR